VSYERGTKAAPLDAPRALLLQRLGSPALLASDGKCHERLRQTYHQRGNSNQKKTRLSKTISQGFVRVAVDDTPTGSSYTWG
jgi:hypothetical protein